MYNPQKIFDLIEKNGVRQKDVIMALKGVDKGNALGNLRQLVERDIRVSTLEKIANYFNVSMDVFFDRDVEINGIFVNGDSHQLKNVTVGQNQDSLKSLLDEKDKRIKLLEEIVELYKCRAESK